MVRAPIDAPAPIVTNGPIETSGPSVASGAIALVGSTPVGGAGAWREEAHGLRERQVRMRGDAGRMCQALWTSRSPPAR